MINEIGSKTYQANKLDNNFGTEGVLNSCGGDCSVCEQVAIACMHCHSLDAAKVRQYVLGYA